jgi:hypothetical protein
LKEREKESTEAKPVLGRLEDQLIQLLSEKSRDKFDLIQAIYGEKLDP